MWGHEATETGFAYAPVSQAHGHNHIVHSPRGHEATETWLASSVWGGGDYGMAQLVAARRLRLATGGPTMLVQHVWTLGLPVIKELQGHVGLTVRRAA